MRRWAWWWIGLVLSLVAGAASAEPTTEQRTGDGFVFEWVEEQAGLARTLAEATPGHMARIYGELGVEPSGQPIHITLLDDQEEMLAVAEARNGGGPPHDWAAGLAYPSRKRIYLHAGVPGEEVERTLQHEIAHVAFDEATGGMRSPIWLHEGIAISLSEGFNYERSLALTEAALGSNLLKMEQIERGFPDGPTSAKLAYAQAINFLGHLKREYGADRLSATLTRMRTDKVDFHTAFEAVYPISFKEIEIRWRASLEVWWGWLPLLFGSTMLWGGATIIFVWAWRRRKRQRAAKLARMKGEDALDMAEDIEIAHGLMPPPKLHDPYEGQPPTIH